MSKLCDGEVLIISDFRMLKTYHRTKVYLPTIFNGKMKIQQNGVFIIVSHIQLVKHKFLLCSPSIRIYNNI